MNRTSGAGEKDGADYNAIAGFYRRHWCNHYHDGLIHIQPGNELDSK